MKKLIKVIVFTVIFFFLFLSIPVFADSNVTFKENSDKFVFIPESKDLFSNFKNIFPGETRTQSILLKNSSSRKLNFYFKIEKHSKCQDGLDSLRDELISLLIFNINYGDGKIHSQKFNDVVQASHLPATDKKKEDYVYLATLEQGENVNIDLELYTPGDLVDNRFQDLDIYVDWYFYIKDLEEEDNIINIKNYPWYKLLQIGEYLLGILGLGILALVGMIIGINKKKG